MKKPLNNNPSFIFKFFNYDGRLSVKVNINKNGKYYIVEKVKLDVDDTLWKLARQNNIEEKLFQLKNHNSQELGGLINYLSEQIEEIVNLNE